MQKLIKILFKDKIIYLAISITLGITYLSLVSINFSTEKITQTDKFYHTFAYFVLGLTWLLSFPMSLEKKYIKYAIVFTCIIYGIVIEVLQGTLTAYRTASLLDVIANTIGVLVAMVLFKSIYKKIIAI
jgi:VanZ family protein